MACGGSLRTTKGRSMKKKSAKQKQTPKDAGLSDLFKELKGEYLDSFPEKIETIRKLWQSGDRKGLHNEFHKIKGTGSTYGLPEVTTIAEILEEMCLKNSDKLGMSIVIALDLMQKICRSHKFELDYDFQKDPLYKNLRVFFEQMELAS
jgi:HPt (histidine-containing phosphotransfer) domain-containing protein